MGDEGITNDVGSPGCAHTIIDRSYAEQPNNLPKHFVRGLGGVALESVAAAAVPRPPHYQELTLS